MFSFLRALSTATVLLVVGVVRLPGQDPGGGRPEPTLILTNGKIFTSDSLRPWADGVAIRGEHIVAVGTTAEMRRLAGAGTQEIALDGRVVIPGINDAHDHPGEAGLGPGFATGNSPTPDPPPSQVLDSLRILAGRAPAGTWLRTEVGLRVLNDSSIDRAALDHVAPDHPVMLHGWWGHGMVLNSAALRALGIADGDADPLGGWLGRGTDGRLSSPSSDPRTPTARAGTGA